MDLASVVTGLVLLAISACILRRPRRTAALSTSRVTRVHGPRMVWGGQERFTYVLILVLCPTGAVLGVLLLVGVLHVG